MAPGFRLQASGKSASTQQARQGPEPEARSPKPSVGRPQALVLAGLLALSGCGEPRKPAPKDEVAWHRLGSWSGRGNTQTESFVYESGALRVRWETTNEQSGRTGQFRLILASAVSGRQLAVPADQRGAGKGESFVAEIPHQAYIVIESSDVDWSFTIDEGTIGTKRGAS